MALEVAVTVDAAGWREALGKAPDRFARRVLSAAAPALDLGGACEVSILLTDDAAVRDLNARYRGQDKATNVLSFENPNDAPSVPAGAAPRLLGDVVLALETVRGEARAQDKSVSDHTAHLLIHGLLHLVGHDHGDSEAAEAMEALEIELLAGLGVADPYAEASRPSRGTSVSMAPSAA